MSDNQHYVTKAHLDKFVHPTSGQNILYPYERELGGRKPTGTKKLGSAEKFYIQIDNGLPTNKLDESRKADEAILFGSGKRTPSALSKCIYDDKFVPQQSEFNLLARAAAFLWWGSPLTIHNAAMLDLMASQIAALNLLNDEEMKANYTSEYGSEADKKLAKHREALLRGDLYFDVGQENWKQLGFEIARWEGLLIDTLCRMGLTICYAQYKSFFLTSDNPVITTSQKQPDRPGFELPDAQIWFPISHRKGLLWTWKHRGVQTDYFGHSQTRVMNRRIVRWCYKRVYSPLPDDWIEAAMRENNFDPRYGHYGSLQAVIDQHSVPIKANGNGQPTREIVDLVAALRAGEKVDVVNL